MYYSFPRSSTYIPHACYLYYFTTQKAGQSYKPTGEDWTPSICSAKLVDTILSPVAKSCAVPACLTSHLSYANEDWVSSSMLPDSHMLYLQIRSLESASRREMVSGHRRNGDVPVVDHTPPGSSTSAVTRVLQQLTPWSWWRTDHSGG